MGSMKWGVCKALKTHKMSTLINCIAFRALNCVEYSHWMSFLNKISKLNQSYQYLSFCCGEKMKQLCKLMGQEFDFFYFSGD